MKCSGLQKNQHIQIQSTEAGQEKKFQERYTNQYNNQEERIEWVTIGVESTKNSKGPC